MLLRSFRYCSVDAKCILFMSYCTNMYCCPLWFNSTSSSTKKLKARYNGVLKRLLLIVKSYSARVRHNIPSFYELLLKSIYGFRERIALSVTKILNASSYYPLSNPTMVEISNVFILIYIFLVLL